MSGHVLITGASRGIGRSTAAAFAQKGYSLTLCCRNGIEALARFSESLCRTCNTDVQCMRTDVGDPAQVNDLVSNAQAAFGPVDILINNAAVSSTGLVTDLSDEAWSRILNTNLSSVFYMSRAVLPAMIHRKSGTIINISSVFGICGASCEAAYAASKGGVNAFTRSLAKELAPSRIRVNAIAFGVIDTQMNDNLTEEEKAALAEEIPAGRFASPDEAASFILQIAQSPDYLTGQVIRFDGGWC